MPTKKKQSRTKATTKAPTMLSKLRTKRNMSLLAFVLVFGAVGGFLTFRSFASSPTLLSLPYNDSHCGEWYSRPFEENDTDSNKKGHKGCQLDTFAQLIPDLHRNGVTFDQPLTDVGKLLYQEGYREAKMCIIARAYRGDASVYMFGPGEDSLGQLVSINNSSDYGVNYCSDFELTEGDQTPFGLNRDTQSGSVRVTSITVTPS